MRRLPLRSPPRVRGKADHTIAGRIRVGITPAYAGKSRGTPFRRTSGRDHPRVCGEKSGFCQRSILHLGSPPRMRGKEQRMREARNSAGITPAYAGKSGYSMKRNHITRDHPRVCGEKQAAGKLCAAGRGITPACAGKSRPRPHPRRCLPSAPWHGGSHGCRG